jgi:hypothetical protein
VQEGGRRLHWGWQRTGPALTRKGRDAMYRLSAHSLCTRNSDRAKLPHSRPSPGTSRLHWGHGAKGEAAGQAGGSQRQALYTTNPT